MKLQEETINHCLARIILIICLIFPVAAFAGAPLEAVKGNVDKVLDVLRDRPSMPNQPGR